MSKPIPMEQVIDVAVSYLVKRQIQGRPTTLRQVSKRVGLGAPTVKAELERHQVQYILIPYGEKDWVTSSIEIVLLTMPENLAERNGYSLEEIEKAYHNYFGKYEIAPLEKRNHRLKPIEDMASNMDPYAAYRIDTDQYRVLKPQLISFSKLIEEARKRGYSGRAVERATGGNRMRYALPSDVWRPYVYRNRKFFLKEVLNYLHQSYRNYKRKSTAAVKKEAREATLEGREPIEPIKPARPSIESIYKKIRRLRKERQHDQAKCGTAS